MFGRRLRVKFMDLGLGSSGVVLGRDLCRRWEGDWQWRRRLFLLPHLRRTWWNGLLGKLDMHLETVTTLLLYGTRVLITREESNAYFG
ncbi:hypothetical protein MUK42_14448 [Musa troglodytarum]|uniref:Uncharacterized protein n=1 Tax=Musa troglodytarum TaxID=320322 RepID=A0A9E7I9L2_9LILI|nr:hypothetical protein MUK42_14448 [Musa troglodytarum]